MTVLFAFDFDRSLIEVNSDTVVIEQLDADLYDTLMRDRGKNGIPSQWTDLMDYSLGELHKRGYTADDISRVLRAIALDQHMMEALRLARQHGDFVILSDANTEYIDKILEGNGIREWFTEIVTNPAQYENGALRVRRLVPASTPHGCKNSCALNMCKGALLEASMSRRPYARVVYVGDSTNDFCPSLRLRSGDVVLARQGLSLEKMLREHADRVQARVVAWASYADILACFRDVIAQAQHL